MGDADRVVAGRTYGLLSPTLTRALSDTVPMAGFYRLGIPRSYLNATEDTALPPAEGDWHLRMSSRLGLCHLVRMPGSHEVMFSNPRASPPHLSRRAGTRAPPLRRFGPCRPGPCGRFPAPGFQCPGVGRVC